MQEFPEAHTGENISDKSIEILDEWLEDIHIIAGTTDGGANVKKSLKDYDRFEFFILKFYYL